MGRGPKFLELLRAIESAVRRDVRVLLAGLSGTGKEATGGGDGAVGFACEDLQFGIHLPPQADRDEDEDDDDNDD